MWLIARLVFWGLLCVFNVGLFVAFMGDENWVRASGHAACVWFWIAFFAFDMQKCAS